jgi:hypothetical protein
MIILFNSINSTVQEDHGGSLVGEGGSAPKVLFGSV